MSNLNENNKIPTYGVLFWADIHADKKGSFEDSICHLSEEASAAGIRILFVLGNRISKSMEEQFEKFGVNYHGLSEKEINSKISLIKILKMAKPQVIHFHFISHCSGFFFICRALGYKNIIYTDHNSRSVPSSGNGIFQWLKYVRRKIYTKPITKFFCVSKFVCDCLRKEIGVSQRRVKVVYNGIDTERFVPIKNTYEKNNLKRKFLNIKDEEFVVSFVGQLIREKGIFNYLEAAKQILEKRHDVYFLVIGDNSVDDQFMNSCRNEKIRFLGLQENVEDYLRCSDILVCPSIWYEAFGLIIAEAGACGVPVVASNLGGIPEVVCDKKTGLLVESDLIIDLRHAIEKLMNDKYMRDRLGKQGQLRVKKLFSLKEMVRKILKEYENMIK